MGSVTSPDEDTRVVDGSPAEAPAALKISSLVASRYLVLAEAGHGAMGRVYRAYDTKLHREVALKVLTMGEREDGLARLMREAQSMAQLSHPNVVPVYDVEHSEGALFIAMEYVAGVTLRMWVAQGQRWRDVLDVYVSAGRGLAAAHAAGVVHRDFKPANAMLGDDGRVRVMDFGLARAGDAWAASPTAPTGDGDDPAAVESMTATGSVMGTPRYMAPEQERGDAASPATDQFSFSVALFEALYGQRPYRGESREQVSRAKKAGQVASVPDGDVPAWLKRVVVRGLHPDPGQRWPSVAALLVAMANDPRRRRRRRAAGFAAALALVGVGAGVFHVVAKAAPEACGGAQAQLAGVWGDDARAAVSEALRATGAPFAQRSALHVAARLDRYSREWVSAQKDACEATEVRKEQSAALLDARMLCLAGRKNDFAALVQTLARADKDVAQRAISAVDGLPSIHPCADASYVTAVVPPPADPAIATRVEALDLRLSTVRAWKLAGRYEQASKEAAAVVAESDALAYAPLRLRALLTHGALLERLGEYTAAETALRQAFFGARATGQDGVRARAAVALVVVVGERLARYDEGRAWADHARAEVQHAGGPEDQADLLSNMGLVALADGKLEQALRHQQGALTLREDAFGPEHLSVAASLSNVAGAKYNLGDLKGALQGFERGLAIRLEILGPEHPDTAPAMVNVAVALASLGELGRAQSHYTRALEILEGAFGQDHPLVATTAHNLATVFSARGEHAQAKKYYERGLEIRRSLFAPDHPAIALSLSSLASAYLGLEDPRAATVVLEEALEIQTKRFGPEHPDLAATLNNLGNAYHDRGMYEESLALHTRNVAVREAALGPDSPKVAMSLANLGRTLRKLGRPSVAVQHLHRAAAIVARADTARVEVRAEIDVRLGSALWDMQAREEAVRIVRGIGVYVGDDPASDSLAEGADSWLAEHPLPSP